MPKKLRRFTKEEDEFLRDNYLTKNYTELGDELGRSCSTIFGRIKRLGLVIPEALKQERKMLGLTEGWKKRPETLFKKGHVPANKGKKMTKDLYDKAAPTMFQKGHRPANYKPVGSERINREGYIEVKVKDPRTWQLKQRVVWVEHMGEIPKGCLIKFKDKNRNNCSIENLYMTDRKGNMKENTIQRFPKEVQTAIRIVGKLNRTIKKHES